jgi:hypothetical protein
MRGLLVRVGADQGKDNGRFNAPVDSSRMKFCYVPIPEVEGKEIKQEMKRPYTPVSDALTEFRVSLPSHLGQRNIHLDPDFKHLTYGDEGAKGRQIYDMWEKYGLDFLVFYAGLKDVNPNEKYLVYAIIGFYWIDDIVKATKIQPNRHDENAHTRRVYIDKDEIVVQAKRGKSGRLERCLPIGSYRPCSKKPTGRPQYRVKSNILEEWSGLSVNDGWLQRSACLPKFKDANRFLDWFNRQCSRYRICLVAQNNLSKHFCCSV